MTPEQIAALPPGPWTDGNGVIRDGNGAFIASSFCNRNSDIAHDEQSKAVAQLLIEARDILAENARLRQALEAIIQRAKTADEFREKHNIAHMGMISMSDPLLIAAQAALAARGM